MADRISTLPDKLLCHILSFLPTKKAVATCVLSKRWKPLWRSVPALNFADYLYIDRTETYGEWTYFKFVQSVYAVLVSRDPRQPIQRFSLTCGCSNFVDPNDINIWVNTVLQCGIEHLHLSLGLNHKIFNSSSAVISCRTLLVLKLDGLATGPFSSVDLPCLKILDLDAVQFLEPKYFAKLLSGCPVLEILKVVSVYYESKKSFLEAFKCLHLPKLVRAHIGGFYMYLLKAVNNAEFLDINEMDVFDHHQGMDCIDYITDTMFSNVTHIELSYFKYNNRNWPLLLEVLDHCPKLQVLVISKVHRLLPDHSYIEETEGDWPYPQSVPTCILLHLKKCSLKSYDGMKGEFRFARYILRNARFLQRMTICNCSRSLPRRNKLKMIKKLSLCTRCSPTCKLSFK